MDPPPESLPNRDLALEQREMDEQRERLEVEELEAHAEADRITAERIMRENARETEKIHEESQKKVLEEEIQILTEKLRRDNERYVYESQPIHTRKTR